MSTMPLSDQIRADVPEWPAELVDLWLVSIALGYGWPPTTNQKWNDALKGKSIDQWRRDVKWNKEERPFRISDLEPVTQLVARGLIDCHVNKKPNQFSTILGSKERLFRCFDYICRYGKFPAPLILLRASDGLEIVDGNHRIAAMVLYEALKRKDLLSEEASPLHDRHELWIGEAPKDWFRDPAQKNLALTWAIMSMPPNTEDATS